MLIGFVDDLCTWCLLAATYKDDYGMPADKRQDAEVMLGNPYVTVLWCADYLKKKENFPYLPSFL